MPLKTTRVEELPVLNLTSMIDVVFLLLIFFMVATNFSQSQQQIGIKLTGNAAAQSMIPKPEQAGCQRLARWQSDAGRQNYNSDRANQCHSRQARKLSGIGCRRQWSPRRELRSGAQYHGPLYARLPT